jgi:uncharacterized protein (UPF0332 family)
VNNGSPFIDFASKISQQASSGAPGWRSAVSRAYYGAYHLARDFLVRQNWHCTMENEHLWVQRHFANCKLPLAKAVGQALANLHQSRKDADYELANAAAETQNNAIACVMRADAIRTQLQQCADPTSLPTILSEMKTYRKLMQWP